MQYLIDPYDKHGLQVPPSNIVCLENEKATRENILSTFKSHFLDNEDIPDRGEATMIFYFAGHGVRVSDPGNLIAKDGKFQAICPVDERTANAAGQYVHAIPDYVLGWLLWELSQKKGQNIVRFCCSIHTFRC
jgi:hypothetical protein